MKRTKNEIDEKVVVNMNKQMNKNSRFLYWIPVGLWMLLIFFFSSQPVDDSWNLSYEAMQLFVPAVKVLQVLFFLLLAGGVLVFMKKKGVQIGLKEVLLLTVGLLILYLLSVQLRKVLAPVHLHHFLRKNAHFFIYLILGVLVKHAFKKSDVLGFKAVVFTLLICAGYAATDEFHQLFVPGRGGLVSDVGIDTAGASLGILLHSVGQWLLQRRKRSKKVQKQSISN